MKISKQLIAALAAVFIVGAGGFLIINDDQSTTESAVFQPQSSDLIQEEQKPEIVISEDQATVSYEGVEGKTALEILKSSVEVSTEESSFGEFVTGINGVLAESDTNYWAFYVEGQYASEGAGTYVTSDGEQIEWRLEDL